MNANEFSDALGEINCSYVAEAVTYRKQGRWIPWAAAAACLILIVNLLLPGSVPAVQNPTVGTAVYWAEGVPLSLPQMAENDLTVESVRIDMDIQTLYHNGTSSMGTAVIEMVLQNPTSKTINVPMTLPCGQPPRYLYTYDKDYNSLCTYPVQSLYRFTLNGSAVHAEHLITATDAAPDRERVQATGLIRLDSPVTKYTYRITELEESENPRLAIWGFSRYSDDIVLLKTDYCKLLHFDQEIIIPASMDSLPRVNDTFSAYVIGDISDFSPAWHLMDWTTQERLDSTIILESTESMTFLDFSNESWSEDLGISQENWAFSVAAEINPFSVLNSDQVDLSCLSIRSRHWLSYELTLAPGETATHRIELPLYPDYSRTNTYHFDLRSLRVLNPTGNQLLTLTTPFEMTETSAIWTQTEDLYQLDLRDLTGLELHFQLSEPRQINPNDPDLIVITPPRWDWLTWVCGLVLVGLFFLHRKYRRERF